MHNRSQDKRRVYSCNVEVWLFVLNKIPGCLLGKCLPRSQYSWARQTRSQRTYLTGPVDIGVIHGFLPGNWVPFLLSVDTGMLFGVDD